LAKLGRPLPDKEKKIKTTVFALLSEEPPGKTVSQICREARQAVGVDRSTVWRHLRRYEKLGLARHEGRFWRWDPLCDVATQPMDQEGRLYVDGLSFEQLSEQRLRELRRKENIYDLWRSLDETKEFKYDPSRPDLMRDAIERAMRECLAEYIRLLEFLVQVPSFAAARELVKVYVGSEISHSLETYARLFWDRRNEVRLVNLNGFEVKLQLQYVKAAVGVPKASR
jgi:hypothetical protein